MPGTGHVDSAKSINDQIHSWWIVEEMPLDPQKPRRKKPVVPGAKGVEENGMTENHPISEGMPLL